jgi:hypothetical protein
VQTRNTEPACAAVPVKSCTTTKSSELMISRMSGINAFLLLTESMFFRMEKQERNSWLKRGKIQKLGR